MLDSPPEGGRKIVRMGDGLLAIGAFSRASMLEAFIPIARPVTLADDRGRVVISEVPAARVAVLVHAGPYDTIDDSYRRLGAWVAHHAEPAGLQVRELYVISYAETDDPQRFRTEICWPILPDTDPIPTKETTT